MFCNLKRNKRPTAKQAYELVNFIEHLVYMFLSMREVHQSWPLFSNIWKTLSVLSMNLDLNIGRACKPLHDSKHSKLAVQIRHPSNLIKYGMHSILLIFMTSLLSKYRMHSFYLSLTMLYVIFRQLSKYLH
mgnify:CR=1 FL=1